MDRKNRSGSRLPVIILCCVLSMAARMAPAEGTFACHVLTDKGFPGVVFVQSDELMTAQKTARRARVDIGRVNKAPVAELVECINFPQGRFADASMRAHVRYLPR